MQALLDEKRPDPRLRRHEPDQAPSQRLFQRPAGELLLLRRMERHDPARVVDIPGARAAAGGDGRSQRILQGAAFEGGINARLGDGASEIRGQGECLTAAHQRCSMSSSTTYANQTSAITASMVTNASTTRRGADVGRRTSASRGRSATAANSSRGTDRTAFRRPLWPR